MAAAQLLLFGAEVGLEFPVRVVVGPGLVDGGEQDANGADAAGHFLDLDANRELGQFRVPDLQDVLLAMPDDGVGNAGPVGVLEREHLLCVPEPGR